MAGAVLIYYVSITGYAQVQPGKRLTFQPIPLSVSAPPELIDGKAKLLLLMNTEKPYLEPELSLADLARRMQTSPAALSQLINAGIGKNFNDFVNEYRVDEFKQQVRDLSKNHLSFLGIALGCGFNSKATFNRAFRKSTGQSPREYAETQKSPSSVTVGASLGS